MQLSAYHRAVEALPFGKRLPAAIYVYREDRISFGPELDQLLAQLESAFQIGPEFNVVKFRTDEQKISFLAYPDFLVQAHPPLQRALTVDLLTKGARRAD